MNKGLSKFMKHVPVKVGDVEGDKKLPYSETCEVAGCDTRYVTASNGYPERHECGKTAVTVDDHYGMKRGICAEHYMRGLVKAGKASNQEMRNSDGSICHMLMAKFQAKAATPKPHAEVE